MTRDEIERASPLVGELLVCDMAGPGNNARRAIRYADLIDDSNPSVPRPLLRPLFEPSLVRVTPRAMLLMGHEVSVLDGVVYEHAQGWLLRLIGDGR